MTSDPKDQAQAAGRRQQRQASIQSLQPKFHAVSAKTSQANTCLQQAGSHDGDALRASSAMLIAEAIVALKEILEVIEKLKDAQDQQET